MTQQYVSISHLHILTHLPEGYVFTYCMLSRDVGQNLVTNMFLHNASVALRQAFDDEKGRIAEFFVGNDKNLLTVRLFFDELSSESNHRTVCKTTKVSQVLLAGTNNLIVFCENQIMMRNLGIKKRFIDITPTALSVISLH